MLSKLLKDKAGILSAGLVVIFFVLKFKDMFLPYFWDEMGVYAGSALYLHDHQLSILPQALPPELSRGHPTLVAFLVGCFFELFGTSVFVGHIVPMITSLALLGAVYYFSEHFFNKMIAVCSLLLVMSTPIFYAQSTMILPEMPLALMAFLSIGFFIQQRWWLYFIAAAMGVLIKETGVIIPLVALGANTVCVLQHKSIRKYLQHSLVILSPLLIFGLFLFIQKIQNGWFFFPYHVSFINFDADVLEYKYSFYSNFIFKEQGRNVWFLICIAAILFIAFKRKDRGIRAILKNWAKPIAVFGFLILSVFISLLFSPDMQRYSLIIIPFFSIVTIVSLNMLFKRIIPIMLISALVLCGINIYYLKDGKFTYDVDMDYTDHLHVMMEAIEYMESSGLQHAKIYSNFPIYFALQDHRFGYLNAQNNFPPSFPIDGADSYDTDLQHSGAETAYLVFCRISPTSEPSTEYKEHFKLEKSFSSSTLGIDIYKYKED